MLAAALSLGLSVQLHRGYVEALASSLRSGAVARDRMSGRFLLGLPRLCRLHRLQFTFQPGKLLGTRLQARLKPADLLLKIFQFHSVAKVFLHNRAVNSTQKEPGGRLVLWKDRRAGRFIVTIM